MTLKLFCQSLLWCKPKKSEGSQEHQSKHRQNQFKKRIHPVAQVEHDSDSSDENYVYAMTAMKHLKRTSRLVNIPFKAIVDTGATINVTTIQIIK